MTSPPPPAAIWWPILLGLCALLLAPLWIVEVPPLLDYPNHLARLFFLTTGVDDVHLARFYAPRWAIIPDLGIDFLGLVLLPWLPVHVAGRIIAGIVLLLPVLGAVAYGSAVAGRRSWWVFGSVLVAFHQSFLLGFLNFTAGMGLALLLAAIWLRWRDIHPGRVILLTMAGCVGLFFCHLMGVVFFAILAGAHELAWLWRSRLRGARVIVARICASSVVFIGPFVLFGFSSFAGAAGQTRFLSFGEKVRQLQAPWINYDVWLDGLAAAVVVVVVAVLMLRQRSEISLRAGITLGLVSLAYWISPAEFSGVSNVDMRFVILFGFLLFCAWAPAQVPNWVAMALAAIFVARLGLLAMLWHLHGAHVAELRRVMAPIAAGSIVWTMVRPFPDTASLRAQRLSNGQRVDAHFPALLMIERRAWWPFLFDNHAQQPITTRSPYRELALRVDGLRGLPGACDLNGIDFLLWMGTDAPTVPYLTTIVVSDVAVLFRVRPWECAGRPG